LKPAVRHGYYTHKGLDHRSNTPVLPFISPGPRAQTAGASPFDEKRPAGQPIKKPGLKTRRGTVISSGATVVTTHTTVGCG